MPDLIRAACSAARTEAEERQRSVPILVIDHMEEKPAQALTHRELTLDRRHY